MKMSKTEKELFREDLKKLWEPIRKKIRPNILSSLSAYYHEYDSPRSIPYREILYCINYLNKIIPLMEKAIITEPDPMYRRDAKPQLTMHLNGLRRVLTKVWLMPMVSNKFLIEIEQSEALIEHESKMINFYLQDEFRTKKYWKDRIY